VGLNSLKSLNLTNVYPNNKKKKKKKKKKNNNNNKVKSKPLELCSRVKSAGLRPVKAYKLPVKGCKSAKRLEKPGEIEQNWRIQQYFD
jgi:hypothetical protein